MTPKLRFFLPAFIMTFPLDQVVKLLIVDRFYYGERLEVVPGLLDFTHVRNPGGAFSFFANAPSEWRLPFFLVTTLLAIVLLIVFLRRLEPTARISAAALGLIMGGALGNLTDRIVYGEVIDFLDVHLWGGYTWPTFNLADSFIVVGVFILILEIFLAPPEVAPEAAMGQSAEP